ncbi:MAG TPA: phospholipase D-like domain-containing protein [Rubrivivax sp.]|nr:phospholipase D-like domain-containing protein [Rubrivivax sp.]
MTLDLLFGTVPIPVWILFLMALVIVGLALVLHSVKRHRDPKLKIECGSPVQDVLPSVAGLSHSELIEGNTVELFQNGAFFDALFEDIARAKVSIHFETFLWKEGELGTRVATALAQRARDGLQVRVLVDDDGGKKMGKAAQQTMKDAGCRFELYHRKTLRNIGKINRRDHRKLAVFDGRIALVGGHCIVDSWMGEAQDKEHVRDIGVRLQGPVVHSMQSTFSENWVDATGELFVGDDVFPALEAVGDVAAHVARVKPEGSTPAVKILHHLMLCLARERLWIQNPYFLPDPAAIKAMCQAVKRGVDVRVMVPSAEASDFPIVQHAAHHNFEALLEGGVRVFEYSRCLLHQKVLTIDGVWCAVGSSNFDDRSFEINDEITVGLRDARLAKEFEAIFEADTEHCTELELTSWRQRGLGHKLKDRWFYLFNEQL